MIGRILLCSMITCALFAECAVAAEPDGGAPKCNPKRAVSQIDYSLLNGPYPRVAPLGYVEFGFTISEKGKAREIVVLASTAHWPQGEELARKVLAGARFDPPEKPCFQSMRFTFKAE